MRLVAVSRLPRKKRVLLGPKTALGLRLMCVCGGVWGERIGKDKSFTPLKGAQRPSLYPRKKAAASGRPGARLQEDRGGRCQASGWPGDPWENAPSWGLASLCLVV